MNISIKLKYLAPVFIVALLLMQGCKSSSVLSEGEAKSDLSSKTIIKNHYRNDIEFNTLRGRIKVDYKGKEDSQSVTLSLRMEKDKVIWVSAPFSVIKVMITPDRVSFYNNLDGTYFDGDYSLISKFLGADLDFTQVQNLLLGQAIFDLKKGDYYAATVNNNYQLKPERDDSVFKRLFLIEPLNFKMALQQISQPMINRFLSARYLSYQNVEGRIIPNELLILAEEGDQKTQIDVNYKSVEFNQKMNFPFEIPKGFTEIIIK